jgi:hypothetical protein
MDTGSTTYEIDPNEKKDIFYHCFGSGFNWAADPDPGREKIAQKNNNKIIRYFEELDVLSGGVGEVLRLEILHAGLERNAYRWKFEFFFSFNSWS